VSHPPGTVIEQSIVGDAFHQKVKWDCKMPCSARHFEAGDEAEPTISLERARRQSAPVAPYESHAGPAAKPVYPPSGLVPHRPRVIGCDPRCRAAIGCSPWRARPVGAIRLPDAPSRCLALSFSSSSLPVIPTNNNQKNSSTQSQPRQSC
jgi:hypothetical protein